MFEYMKSWPIVLVTGPQRSGTTICARMIENDAGHQYLDEELWQVWNGEKARLIAEKRKPCVLQAPGLLKDVLKFSDPDCMVVVMQRPIPEIVVSQRRVGWNVWAKKELGFYNGDPEFDKNPELWVASAKYANWALYWRDLTLYWEEIQYESLKAHPMWLDKEAREGFNARQYYKDQT